MRVLVTGASGYVGGRLVPRLLDAGHEVRCLTRTPAKLDDQPWRMDVEVFQGDVASQSSLKEAAAGCDAAVYLVHSLAAGTDFAELDRVGATNFRDAAAEAGLRHVVYLGQLTPRGSVPDHLASRVEVGHILAGGDVPVTELRSGPLLGSGSRTFDLVRSLSRGMPLAPAPRWVRTRCRPTAIPDALAFITAALHQPPETSRVLDAGGPEELSFGQMIRRFANLSGRRRRRLIPVPGRFTRLSALYLGLVTPFPTRMTRQIVDGLRRDPEPAGPSAAETLGVTPTTFDEVIRRALDKLPARVETSWSDATGPAPIPSPDDPSWSGDTLLTDRRVIPTDADPDLLFWAVCRIGGPVGYYAHNWAWRVRGILDQLAGGAGVRRGRRHPWQLRVGDAVDFWRVDAVVPNRMIRLHSEMKMPGDAWLQWEMRPTDGGCDLVQTAWFAPKGKRGKLYWYAVIPAHRIVFPAMACGIAATAEERGYSCA